MVCTYLKKGRLLARRLQVDTEKFDIALLFKAAPLVGLFIFAFLQHFGANTIWY